MLVTLKEVLEHARKHKYAVPAFDCIEDIMVRAILETCQTLRSPVILMCLPGPDMAGNGWLYTSGLIKTVAKGHDIPIVLHLDHATDIDLIKRAVDDGFASVMYDGSCMPLDGNIQNTKVVAEIAHAASVSVEAELGFVGGSDVEATTDADSVLTEPKEVQKFVEFTGVDALAVSIGTSHGIYKSLPKLDIEKLKELNAVSKVPLVLHGGSGTPDDQLTQAIANGICKLNIYADCRIAMAKGLKAASSQMDRPDPIPGQMLAPIKKELAKVVEEKVRLFGSNNRI